MHGARTSVAGCTFRDLDSFSLPTKRPVATAARMEIGPGLISTKSSSPSMAMAVSGAKTVLIGFDVSVVMLQLCVPVDSEPSTYRQASPAAQRAVSDGPPWVQCMVTTINVCKT